MRKAPVRSRKLAAAPARKRSKDNLLEQGDSAQCHGPEWIDLCQLTRAEAFPACSAGMRQPLFPDCRSAAPAAGFEGRRAPRSLRVPSACARTWDAEFVANRRSPHEPPSQETSA